MERTMTGIVRTRALVRETALGANLAILGISSRRGKSSNEDGKPEQIDLRKKRDQAKLCKARGIGKGKSVK